MNRFIVTNRKRWLLIMKLVIKYLDDNTKRLHTRRFNNVVYNSSFEQWPAEAQKLIDDMGKTIISIYFQTDLFERLERNEHG